MGHWRRQGLRRDHSRGRGAVADSGPRRLRLHQVLPAVPNRVSACGSGCRSSGGRNHVSIPNVEAPSVEADFAVGARRSPLIQWRRLDTTLITRPTMTAPNKYERRACDRATLRILLLVRFVSDT